jgi:quercetin dioxygenase-like cupin family protein
VNLSEKIIGCGYLETNASSARCKTRSILSFIWTHLASIFQAQIPDTSPELQSLPSYHSLDSNTLPEGNSATRVPTYTCAKLRRLVKNMRNPRVMIFFLLLGQFSPAQSQEHKNPVLPSCFAAALKDGNPDTGPAIVHLKFQPGCVIPWHWHTPNERVIVISGSAKAEMRGMDPVMLKQGDFILFSAKQIHQFTAVTAADIYVMNDSAFDIHYVDASGREIPPQAALAPK